MRWPTTGSAWTESTKSPDFGRGFFVGDTVNEGSFIKYVVGKLPKTVHSQSMTFGSRSFGGTPDRYFDGPLSDLWVEFKFQDSMPRSGMVGGVHEKKRGCYSQLQYDWMCRRHLNGKGSNMLGIIALKNRTAVIQTCPEEWLHGSSIESAIPWRDVATKIEQFCTGEISEKPTLLVGRGARSWRPDDQRGVRRCGVPKRSTKSR